jgi:hypothetical protein
MLNSSLRAAAVAGAIAIIGSSRGVVPMSSRPEGWDPARFPELRSRQGLLVSNKFRGVSHVPFWFPVRNGRA